MEMVAMIIFTLVVAAEIVACFLVGNEAKILFKVTWWTVGRK